MDGHNLLVPWMWTALGLMGMALLLFVIPATRRNETSLAVACAVVFIGIWIDKGLGLITGGFVPTPMHRVVDYIPTLPELVVSLGIYAIGLFILTLLVKIALMVRQEA